MPEDTDVFLAGQIQMVFQGDPVLGDGPGFVGAENIDGAQILDGVEVLDDDLLLGQIDRALGQAGRDNHGKHFGGQADSQ